MNERYIVMVEKSGGYTGYGCAVLKSNGVPQVFETKEAAEVRAAEYRRQMNNPYSLAAYRAWVEVYHG